MRLATSDWQSIPGTSEASCSLIWYGCGISPVTISRIRTPRLKMSIYAVQNRLARICSAQIGNLFSWSKLSGIQLYCLCTLSCTLSEGTTAAERVSAQIIPCARDGLANEPRDEHDSRSLHTERLPENNWCARKGSDHHSQQSEGNAEHLLITPPPTKHLGRGVCKGPEEPGCCREMGLSHNTRETNISNLGHGALLVEEDILGLQIAVDHLRMHTPHVRSRVQARQHLAVVNLSLGASSQAKPCSGNRPVAAHARTCSAGAHLSLVQLAEAQGQLRRQATATSLPLYALLPEMEGVVQIPSLRI